MDNEISNVGTQYIICECGDNFPNEKFLNKHLANGHGEVEAFQCDVCPEMFTSSNSLSRHMYTHQAEQSETVKKPELKMYSRKTLLKECPEMFTSSNSLSRHMYAHQTEQSETVKKPELKTYSRKTLLKEVKKEKKQPPVIKLKNLTRIDSISLIENLKTFGRFIKIEPQVETPEPQPDPQPDPESEPDPEPDPEPDQPVMEEQDEEGQVIVKNEMQETAEEAEEIYYQCDVCNSIFYTEWDFNVHYQSAHALKLEPAGSAEQVLERHLVTDHADDEGVKAEADTAYYYECELGKGETDKFGPQTANTEGLTDNTDVTCGIYPNSEDAVQEIDEHGLLKVVQVKVVKKGGRPKKIKRGRPPKEDVYSNMPPGLSYSQRAEFVKKRRIEIRKEQLRKANKNYKKKHPERVAKALEKYKKRDPERVALSHRKAVAKYAKNHPEIHRRSSAKYAKTNPEVNRRASRKYQEKKKLERLKMREEANTLKVEIKEEVIGEVETNSDLNGDIETRMWSENSVEDNIYMQELDDHGLVKVKEVKKRGRPKKVKAGRPHKVNVDLDIPPRLSLSQIEALSITRRIEIKKEQSRKSSEKYTKNNPEVNRRSSTEYQEKRLEILRVKEETTTASHEIEIKHEDFNEVEIEFEEILGY